MGITASKDRNTARYQLYEAAPYARVESIRLVRQAHGDHQVPAQDEWTSTAGQGIQPQQVQAIRDPDDASQIMFEVLSTESLAKSAGVQHAVATSSAERDHHELSWICDPAAQRKTSRTSFLRVSSYEDEELILSVDVTLLQENVRSSTLSTAYAHSPEDLERILAERKRGNVGSTLP